jgi:hypothetical protein
VRITDVVQSPSGAAVMRIDQAPASVSQVA